MTGFRLITLLWLCCATPLHAAALHQAQLWTGATETRLVLLLDGTLQPRLHATAQQLRITLPGLTTAARLPTVGAQHPALKSLRLHQQTLVLGLAQTLTPKSYTLPQPGGWVKFVLELPHPKRVQPVAIQQPMVQHSAVRHPTVPDKVWPRKTPVRAAVPVRSIPQPAPVGTLSDTLRAEFAAAGLLEAATPHPEPTQSVAAVAPQFRQTPAVRPRIVHAAGRDVVVAIDAGHGGKDPGAIGPNGTQEKTVTLAVARRLQTLLNAQEGVKAVLTRDGDYFIPLHQRVQRARAQKADLFISIHADAAPNGAARGASIYTLSDRGASSTAAKWLADRENAADLIGGVSLDDKDAAVSKVLLDLSQTGSRLASTRIARVLLGKLDDVGAIHKREVQAAGFAVLKAPDIPSILVETAFISTPQEERLLASPPHQAKLAQALAQGIVRHFQREPPPGTALAQRQPAVPAAQASAADDAVPTP